jgi:hypothetical protein
MDENRYQYERSKTATLVTKKITYKRIDDIRRRLYWRARELGDTVTNIMRKAYIDDSYGWQMIGKKAITYRFFMQLTEAFRMDEVDGWDRPYPEVVPPEERRKPYALIEAEASKKVAKMRCKGHDDIVSFVRDRKREDETQVRNHQRRNELPE